MTWGWLSSLPRWLHLRAQIRVQDVYGKYFLRNHVTNSCFTIRKLRYAMQSMQLSDWLSMHLIRWPLFLIQWQSCIVEVAQNTIRPLLRTLVLFWRRGIFLTTKLCHCMFVTTYDMSMVRINVPCCLVLYLCYSIARCVCIPTYLLLSQVCS